MDMKDWYVIQTKPREEEKASFFLAESDIEVYLPKMEICTFKVKKRVFARKPLFPGYLFACFDTDEDLSRVRWTRGVNKILPESINPVPLYDSVVESIKNLAGKDNIIRKRNLKKNNRIRIIRGPMKGLPGIFENWVSDQGRVKILLDLLNYQARVELHNSLIEKVA
jgi:transcriptional antiterminator RfaH